MRASITRSGNYPAPDRLTSAFIRITVRMFRDIAVPEAKMLHMLNPRAQDDVAPRRSRSGYVAPATTQEIDLKDLLAYCGRTMDDHLTDMFRTAGEAEPPVFYAGDLALLKQPAVSVIGAREVSEEGLARARRIAREMAKAGVLVTSGLAKGVDTAAHLGALEVGGSTMAVIGTSLDKVYPAENAELQGEIWSQHLLVSQFRPGTRTYPSDFPKRNRLMAALTDASIIVEASDTSGTLHQAKECVRLNRWLFIMRSVVEDERLTWPARFLREERVRVLTAPQDVLSVIGLA